MESKNYDLILGLNINRNRVVLSDIIGEMSIKSFYVCINTVVSKSAFEVSCLFLKLHISAETLGTDRDKLFTLH